MNVHARVGLYLPKVGYLYPLPPDQPPPGRFTLPVPLPAHPTFLHPSLSFLFTAKRLSPHDDVFVMATGQQATPDTVDDSPPISVPDSGDTGESGKLKMIVQLVRKCMGIKDIASMWVSSVQRRPRC